MNEKLYQGYISRVIDAGQGNKSQLKDATDACNRFYEEIRERNFNQWLTDHPALEQGAPGSAEAWKIRCSFDGPFGLHQVRDRHQKWFGNDWVKVQELVELRAAIKALPVVTRIAKVTPEQQILATLKKEYEARQRNLDLATRAVELFGEIVLDERATELLGKDKWTVALPLSTHAVYCSNSFGTNWVRVDWYLRGKKTKFADIVFAAQELLRKAGKA